MTRFIQGLRSATRLFFLLLLLLVTEAVVAQSPDTEQFKEAVERYMNAAVAHDYFSGSILIANSGVSLFSKGYGMANYEHGVPNTTSTVFQIGSLTKQFTSMAIMQLVERGKIAVSDPVAKYIDNCPDAWKSVTIQHLLTHTSGIINVSSLPDWDEKHSIQPYSRTELMDLYRQMPLQFKPGEKHKYSNSNYHLLGAIIERTSGISYYEYLDQNIFKPLGMVNTGYVNPRQVVPNRAAGYYSVLTTFINAPYLNIGLTYSSGALRSTLGDLLLWDQALYTTKLVSQKSMNEIFTPVKNNYGYGWIIANKFNRKTMSHSGSVNGFSSYLLRFPEEKITIIVLCNSDKASATKVAHELSSIVYNQPYKVPEAQPYELLAKAYDAKGVEAAMRLYRELKKKYSDKIDEELLNDFGYDLLEINRAKEAIQIFRLNVEENPQSSNAHDSLGEAYRKNNDVQLSAESYKKALELDTSMNQQKKD